MKFLYRSRLLQTPGLISCLLLAFVTLLMNPVSQLLAQSPPKDVQAITLISNSKAQCVIVVAPGVMTWEGDDKTLSRWSLYSEEAERCRRLQRDSINDLAHYLQLMTQAPVEVADQFSPTDKRLPIYVGQAAQNVFGPVGISYVNMFGFRLIVTNKGIGLYGESEYGTSYAIYELLHRLGCRWFMPSKMGEVIPQIKTITLEPMDVKLKPATQWRRIENRTADADFRRRNRMGGSADGGNIIQAHHALESYITKEQREQNPQWCLHIDGKPHPYYLRWTRQDVAEAIADTIIKRLDENYTDRISLSPGDYVVPTEDPEERKHDPVPRVWEPAANRWSVTDRLVMLTNRVAERVGEKYPDVRFGLIAYVNYSMPPAREKVHPNVIPELAPIDFNRHHPMTWENHPNKFWLLDMLQGWGKAAPSLAYYAYGMNLAEITAPNPFITKWGTDLPIILANNCQYWAPETMGGWESMMPGFYLSMRLSFDPTEKPKDIIDDLMTRLYGNAAKPMQAYWMHMDKAWIQSHEYSGSGFGYLRIFTPEVMTQAREHINQALALCKTIPEFQRVQMIDQSLALLELFMKMRHDFADGKLRFLSRDLEVWRSSVRHLSSQYREQYSFDSGLAINYVNACFGNAYDDASVMNKTYLQLGKAITQWKYLSIENENDTSTDQPWLQPDFDDTLWAKTHVVEDTWSRLGYHNKMGVMVYRADARVKLPPEGKRVHLWIASTDGSAKVYINGKHIEYVVPQTTRKNQKGEHLEAFTGYCQPAQFDITDALVDGQNKFTIVCERTWLNELGTGGLMGPVVLFQDK